MCECASKAANSTECKIYIAKCFTKLLQNIFAVQIRAFLKDVNQMQANEAHKKKKTRNKKIRFVSSSEYLMCRKVL